MVFKLSSHSSWQKKIVKIMEKFHDFFLEIHS